MLPDLPGEKILFHQKKHNNSIPVIVISAKNQPEIRINLLRSGADDYITKPFYHEEVLARIESVFAPLPAKVPKRNIPLKIFA